MPTSTSTSSKARQGAFEASLATLGSSQRDLVDTLRKAKSPPGLLLETATDGGLTGTLDGTRLASRHQPIREGTRLADEVDLENNAAIVVHGLGLGHHVAALATRLKRLGVIIVIEPDVGLIRAVFEERDPATWLGIANIVFITDPSDRGEIAQRLEHADWALGQGVAVLEHPASRNRVADAVREFSSQFTEAITRTKLSLTTTLVRCVATMRNQIGNLSAYTREPGIAAFKDAQPDRSAVIVSAGPSLARNVDLLAQPGVRDRCVIIAAQTVLRPLLARGVRPHFVTALDFHAISTRFYEGLAASDVEGIDLILDPKAHPSIADAYPGRVRCCESTALDQLLGPAARPMGHLPPGATVAHLALYVAEYLGCSRIALVGQDLGFSEGLYYASGAAIHETWAPELGPFNSIAQMEWRRIMRGRRHLVRKTDVFGDPIFSDAQMVSYLQQFERDFRRLATNGRTVIDATEGGVRKQHTDPQSLSAFLDGAELPLLPFAPDTCVSADAEQRTKRVDQRLHDVAKSVARLREAANRTTGLLADMQQHQHDRPTMEDLFARLGKEQAIVAREQEAFKLVDHLNQLGLFRRLRADRKIAVGKFDDAYARQRAELERDEANVTWIVDAADEMLSQISDARSAIAGRAKRSTPTRQTSTSVAPPPIPVSEHGAPQTDAGPLAIVIPIDPFVDGLGRPRDLAAPPEDDSSPSVLAATVARALETTERLEVILITSAEFDPRPLLKPEQIASDRVSIESVDGPVFDPAARAIGRARSFQSWSWRGGVAGLTVYDEVLAAKAIAEVSSRRQLGAALVVGADWTHIDPDVGLDAIARRHHERGGDQRLMFVQAQPGVGGMLLRRDLIDELATTSRLATIGWLLGYQPRHPQSDAITTDACVIAPVETRLARTRRIGDSREPDHLLLQLDTRRLTGPNTPPLVHTPHTSIATAADGFSMTDEVFTAALDWVRRTPHSLVTLGGPGDPLDHPNAIDWIHAIRDAGAHAIHLRTFLDQRSEVIDSLMGCDVDVLSVELHGTSAETSRLVCGHDRYTDVMENVQRVIENRTPLSDTTGFAAIASPWIVPRIQRRRETLADIEAFHEHWQHVLGTVAIDDVPASSESDRNPATNRKPLLPARVPDDVAATITRNRWTIAVDGSVPYSESDASAGTAGSVLRDDPRRLRRAVQEWRASRPKNDPALRPWLL